jgi:hypothetical protein
MKIVHENPKSSFANYCPYAKCCPPDSSDGSGDGSGDDSNNESGSSGSDSILTGIVGIIEGFVSLDLETYEMLS